MKELKFVEFGGDPSDIEDKLKFLYVNGNWRVVSHAVVWDGTTAFYSFVLERDYRQ